MAVSANDQVARTNNALLGQKSMLDAHAAYLPIMGDALLTSEITRSLGLLGRVDVFVRRVMVGDDKDTRRIEDLANADLIERLDGDWGCHVIRKNKIEIAFD